MNKLSILNLGWANGWASTPDIVVECHALGHVPRHTNLDLTMRGLNTEVRCDECGYVYHYDSSG